MLLSYRHNPFRRNCIVTESIVLVERHEYVIRMSKLYDIVVVIYIDRVKRIVTVHELLKPTVWLRPATHVRERGEL